ESAVKPGHGRILPPATHDPRHMRAMAVLIGGVKPGNETLAVNDARAGAVGRLQIVMIGDAAVDYGHAHAGAVVTEIPRHVCAHGCRGDIQSTTGGAVRRNVADV